MIDGIVATARVNEFRSSSEKNVFFSTEISLDPHARMNLIYEIHLFFWLIISRARMSCAHSMQISREYFLYLYQIDSSLSDQVIGISN